MLRPNFQKNEELEKLNESIKNLEEKLKKVSDWQQPIPQTPKSGLSINTSLQFKVEEVF